MPGKVALFPAWEALPYEGISPSPEVAGRRAFALRTARAAAGPSPQQDRPVTRLRRSSS